MKKILLNIFLVFACFSFQSCYKEKIFYDSEPGRNLEQVLLLRINNKDCALDIASSQLRYSIQDSAIDNFSAHIKFQNYSEVYFNDKRLKNNQHNILGRIEIDKKYPLRIITGKTTTNFTLSFTSLPIVQIVTTNKILDEPKTLARVYFNYPDFDKPSLSPFIGIEQRGGSTQNYPKKSFGFSFLKNTYLDETVSLSVFDMKSNKDWILDAMYLDKTRLRSKSCFEIWNNLDGKNHYEVNEKFVELYINQEHMGLYCLSEIINSELLGLSDGNAVLYKAIDWANGATSFETFSGNNSDNEIWDGWEQKHPEPKERLNWEPLRKLREIVVNKSDSEFVSLINSALDVDIFIDYFIFLNLVQAGDNTAKNNFLTRTAQEPLIYIPWDLDLTMGLVWPGVHWGHTSIISNNLYSRMLALDPSGFKNKLKARWVFLRSNALLTSSLRNIFENNFNEIGHAGIIEIENKKWNENINIADERSYIDNWIVNRLNFLDEYYSNL